MQVRELIQRVQSVYSKGVESDDSRLSSRHIYNKLLTVRSRLISQEAKKKQKISPWNYQTLHCVELITVPKHECPCLPPIGCEILRSRYVLPKPLNGINGELIKSVTTIDRTLKIDEIAMNAINFQKGNKYTSKKVNYFIQEGYLYIITPTKMKALSITGLFEDPIQVEIFQGLCDCQDCTQCIDYYATDFPIDSSLIDALIELTLQEVVVLFSQTQEDVSNNSIESNREQGK